jgi:hypothetical protein
MKPQYTGIGSHVTMSHGCHVDDNDDKNFVNPFMRKSTLNATHTHTHTHRNISLSFIIKEFQWK